MKKCLNMYECTLHKATVVIYTYDTNCAFLGYSKKFKKIQGFIVDKMAKIPKSQYMLLDSRAVLQYCVFKQRVTMMMVVLFVPSVGKSLINYLTS